VSTIWLPGTAGPLDELVVRIQRRIDRFAEEHGLERPLVEVELADGALLVLSSMSAEPGYGFLTLVPHPDEEGDDPYELVVPLGAIRQVAIRVPEPARGRFGFAGFQA